LQLSAGAAADVDRQLLVRGARSYRPIFAARARAQQQTSRTPLLLSIDETDGRTDKRTPDRYIDPAPHTMCRAASK